MKKKLLNIVVTRIIGRKNVRMNHLQLANEETNRNSPNRIVQDIVGQKQGKLDSMPTCFIHPWAKHRTSDCRQFLSKTVEERRELVRDHRLCYHCLQRHLARHCPQKTRCEKCQGGHSQLLHLEHKDHVQSCFREQVN